jgi:hypothetical protein
LNDDDNTSGWVVTVVEVITSSPCIEKYAINQYIQNKTPGKVDEFFTNGVSRLKFHGIIKDTGQRCQERTCLQGSCNNYIDGWSDIPMTFYYQNGYIRLLREGVK